MNHFPFQCVDLTHVLSPNAPSWDGDCGFELKTCLDYEQCTTQTKFRVQQIKLYCGMGTHMDAPAHCISQGNTIEAFDLETLISPCIVIDISKKAHTSYELSTKDIQAFETLYGPIPEGTFIIVHTGWDRFWETPDSYRAEGHFPSVSEEAALYLLTKNIIGLGIDTLSPDRPDSDYPVHQYLLSHGKYLVENVAQANALPPTGSFIAVMPMKIAHATEAPIRLVGLIPQNNYFALQELIQLEKQVRNFGFDWPDIPTIIQQAHSECLEIEEVIQKEESSERLQEEISDLLHTAISLCLFAGFSVEESIANVVKKFGGRMDKVMHLAEQQGLTTLKGQSFEFMLTLWDKAKRVTPK